MLGLKTCREEHGTPSPAQISNPRSGDGVALGCEEKKKKKICVLVLVVTILARKIL
jgi:hypothetical protein